MRAEDHSYDDYVSEYAGTHGMSDDEVEDDLDFRYLWAHRHDSDDAMTDLLAETLQLEWDVAHGWIEGVDS